MINVLCCVIQNQWEWLKNQAGAQAELISDLLEKLAQFNLQYGELGKFVQDGRELLASEKPVGESASRIQEQMKTCQVGTVTHTHTTHTKGSLSSEFQFVNSGIFILLTSFVGFQVTDY